MPKLSSLQNDTQLKSLTHLNSTFLIFATLLSLSIFLPSMIHQQGITGPLINAILLLSTLWLSTNSALMIGLLPSVVALSRGLLPLPLAPVVPFIMLANACYILVFNQLYSKSFSLAVVSAAVVKFGLLYFVSQQLLASLLPAQFMTAASQMMSWPQLVTALVGGVIAWLVSKSVPGFLRNNPTLSQNPDNKEL